LIGPPQTRRHVLPDWLAPSGGPRQKVYCPKHYDSSIKCRGTSSGEGLFGRLFSLHHRNVHAIVGRASTRISPLVPPASMDTCNPPGMLVNECLSVGRNQNGGDTTLSSPLYTMAPRLSQKDFRRHSVRKWKALYRP
jgi:hypothetical protein